MSVGLKERLKLGEEKIYFNGLRNEREQTIFLDAFNYGLCADERIKQQIRNDMSGCDTTATIRRAITKT